MIKVLVILFIIKLFSEVNKFKDYQNIIHIYIYTALPCLLSKALAQLYSDICKTFHELLEHLNNSYCLIVEVDHTTRKLYLFFSLPVELLRYL